MSIIEKFEKSSLVTPLQAFHPISLERLNEKAEMLTRLDNKYIVKREVLCKVLAELSESFDVLEIGAERRFLYRTRYFDDAERSCFLRHHNGRRQRIKLRTRHYVSSDSFFLEAKVKDVRGVTVKRRKPIESDSHHELFEDAQAFANSLYTEFYGKSFDSQFEESLRMEYFRSTFVARTGGERLTIDNGVRFFSNEGDFRVDEDIYIVETKSRNGNGLVDSLLRRFHQHPLNKCSKYCLGLCMTGAASKMNNFKPIIKRLSGAFVPSRIT